MGSWKRDDLGWVASGRIVMRFLHLGGSVDHPAGGVGDPKTSCHDPLSGRRSRRLVSVYALAGVVGMRGSERTRGSMMGLYPAGGGEAR